MRHGTTPATAVADDGGHLLVDVPGDGAGFASDTSTPLIHALRLAPGSEVSGDLALKNDSGVTAHLVLQSVDVHDDDNGCNLPETRDGDTTCGRDGGELGRWLVVTVSREVGGALREVWHGSLADLGSGVDMHADMAPGETWPVRVRVALPYAATNETQSDRISFAMRWSAAADLGGGAAPLLLGVALLRTSRRRRLRVLETQPDGR